MYVTVMEQSECEESDPVDSQTHLSQRFVPFYMRILPENDSKSFSNEQRTCISYIGFFNFHQTDHKKSHRNYRQLVDNFGGIFCVDHNGLINRIQIVWPTDLNLTR